MGHVKIDSREISDLRPDVAANVRIFISMMKDKGFPVGISSTFRNDEQQAYLYAQGRTRPGQIVTGSPVTTFHGAKLAFDIFQNIKGKEWNDPKFWAAAREILTAMGFSFLKSEMPHSQWSAGGHKTGAQVRTGDTPRLMPLYKVDPGYKAIIQSKCNFSDPNGVWTLMDKHPYADAFYKKWAESYK